jgi:hypothetical protein
MMMRAPQGEDSVTSNYSFTTCRLVWYLEPTVPIMFFPLHVGSTYNVSRNVKRHHTVIMLIPVNAKWQKAAVCLALERAYRYGVATQLNPTECTRNTVLRARVGVIG